MGTNLKTDKKKQVLELTFIHTEREKWAQRTIETFYYPDISTQSTQVGLLPCWNWKVSFKHFQTSPKSHQFLKNHDESYQIIRLLRLVLLPSIDSQGLRRKFRTVPMNGSVQTILWAKFRLFFILKILAAPPIDRVLERSMDLRWDLSDRETLTKSLPWF